jgi:serine/threonine-protein kinase
VVLVAIPLFAVAAQSPAQAYYVGKDVLRGWHTGKCLDSDFSGNVYTNSCYLPIGSNPHQIWEPLLIGRTTSDDVVLLRNEATRRCLAWYSSGRTNKIITDDCSGRGFGRLWLAVGNGWSNVVFQDSTGYKVCLDHDGTGFVYPYNCNYGAFQHWSFGY